MRIDDSFKKPGAVPFKWEIRPGVPKIQNPQPPLDNRHIEPKQHQVQQKQSKLSGFHSSGRSDPFPETPSKLKPPPAGFYFHPQLEPRTYSFRSSPSTRSHRFGIPALARPDIVSSVGCFPSPLVKRKKEKKRIGNPGAKTDPEYYSDLDIPSRWSVSSRNPVSPLSSSFASYQSSPPPVSDAEWATFELFF